MRKELLLPIWLLFVPFLAFGQIDYINSDFITLSNIGPGVYEPVMIPLGEEDPSGAVVKKTLVERFPQVEQGQWTLELTESIESPGGHHLAFSQRFENIAVYHAGIKANLDHNGTIRSVMNNLVPATSLTRGEFRGSANEAKEWAMESLQDHEFFSEVEVAAFYYPTEEGLLPIYQVQTAGSTPQSHWEVLVHAHDLQVILRKVRAISSHHVSTALSPTPSRRSVPNPSPVPSAVAAPPPANGRGMIFNPDPLTHDHTSYGSTTDYEDNGDQDSPALDSARIMVTLKDIELDLNGIYHLNGPYVTIQDVQTPVDPPATSTNGDFFFQRSEQGFEDVMSYYHVDSAQRYIQSLGYINLLNQPIWVDPHGMDYMDQSTFIPPLGGSAPTIAMGQGGVDDAEDADVILHHYAHGVANSAAPSTNSGYERRGLDEGLAYYFEFMWSAGIDTFRRGDMNTWNAHNPFIPGVSLPTTHLYPPSNPPQGFYAYAEIWASAMMEAHDHPGIGRMVNNKVVLESLYGWFINATLPDAAHLMLDADSLLYAGVHDSLYRDIFCRWNILTGADCPGVTSIEEANGEWGVSIFPNPADEYLNVRLETVSVGHEWKCQITDLLGKTIWTQSISKPTTPIFVGDWQPGVYIINLQDETGKTYSKKWVNQ